MRRTVPGTPHPQLPAALLSPVALLLLPAALLLSPAALLLSPVALWLWPTAAVAQEAPGSAPAAPVTTDFPKDYYDSRERFRAACPVLPDENTVCENFAVDPREDLSVDSLFWRAPDSKKILVLVSGVHGIETYAGAAVQRDFVEENLSRFLDQGISVFLVHALNPWGYARDARVTANNVDLNRNFPSRQDENLAPNAGYRKLKATLAPEDLGGPGWFSFADFAGKLLWRIATFQFTVDEMNQAVAGGQREEARGLFYGGKEPEPQVEWLRRQLDEKLAGFEEALMIDIHTGLGERGVLHLMPSDEPSPTGAELRDRLFGADSNEVYQITTGDTKGFYTVAGDFLDFAEERGPDGLRIAAMTMEFGTKGTGIPAQLASLHIMAVENARRLTPWGPERERDIARSQADFMELFAPHDPEWREGIRAKARGLFDRVLTRWSARAP